MFFKLDSPAILIVDPVSTDRERYRRSLLMGNSERYQILEAASPKVALTLCQSNRPDLILLNDDFSLDESIDFLEACYPWYREEIFPIVILTERCEPSQVLSSLKKYGIEDCWNKAHLTPEIFPFLVQATIHRLHLQIQLVHEKAQQQLIDQVAHRISQSLSFLEILQPTLDEVRQFLQAERLVLYQNDADGGKTVVVESLSPSRQGYSHDLPMHSTSQEEEKWVIPIRLTTSSCLHGGQSHPEAEVLWGWLVAYEDDRHPWHDSVMEFLSRLAVQLTVAIQQTRIQGQLQAEIIELVTYIESYQEAATVLKQGEVKYQALIYALPDLIMQMNGEGNYLEFFSTETFNVFGSRDLLGTNIYDGGLPIHLAYQRMIYIQQALQTKSLQVYEQEILVGHEIRTEEVRVAVCGENEVLVIVRDITDRKRVEEALRRSETTQRTIIEAIPDLLIRANAQGQNLEMLSGDKVNVLYPSPDVQISTVFDILPEFVARERMHYIQQALQTRMLQNYEQQLEIAGETRYEEVRIAPMTSTEVLVIIRDITDRKQAEQALHELNQELETRIAERTAALRESEERWQLAIQGCNDSIWDWNLKSQSIFRSSRWRTLRGYADHEIGSTYEEWINGIHPEDYGRVLQAIQDHLAGNTAFYEQEYRIRCKDGSYVWILDRGQALWDEQGNPIRMTGSETDISDRKQIEEQLRQSEAHLNQAQRIAQLGSWEFDLQTEQITWSQEVFQIYGRDPADGIPSYTEFLKSVYSEDRTTIIEAAQKVIQGGDAFDIEFRAYRKDGSLCYLQGRGEFKCNVGGAGGRLVGTVFDITNRKQTEAELRRLNEQLTLSNAELHRATRLKDEFLANMSHELRTPLNAVLGMTEGLQEGVFGVLNDRQRQALATVERSGKHLLELIDDILDLSKIESGKLELQKAPVTVYQLCESSLALVRQQAIKKNIYLTSEIPQNLPKLTVDERRIRQVLINLLSNAVKFTPDGGTVRLEVRPDLQAANPTLSFSVVDTGIGIAEENLGKLFQPFVQVDSRLNRQYSGTGLGLALVRRLIELHEGTVSVTSILGQGSCFTICLAYTNEMGNPKIVGHSELMPTSNLSQFGNPSAETKPVDSVPPFPLILLAEDHDANIVTLSGYLKGRGYRLTVAKNGKEAIDRALEQIPDLILMDIQMPEMDGLEAIRVIRANPQLSTVPIIALTAFAMSGDREKCLTAGADDYITKPIKLKPLVEKIQHLLSVNKLLNPSRPEQSA